jgi:hypothetical protein
MALTKTNLSYMGGPGKAPRLWSYTTTDTIAATVAANYFLGVYQQLQVGDFMLIRAANATAVVTDMIIAVVLTCTSAGVTVATKSA